MFGFNLRRLQALRDAILAFFGVRFKPGLESVLPKPPNGLLRGFRIVGRRSMVRLRPHQFVQLHMLNIQFIVPNTKYGVAKGIKEPHSLWGLEVT